MIRRSVIDQKQSYTSTRPLNPFPHDKILDQTELKAFADDKLNVTKKKKKIFLSLIEKKTLWEKEKLLVQTISPQYFQKASFLETSKGVIVWEWVKMSLKVLKKAYF